MPRIHPSKTRAPRLLLAAALCALLAACGDRGARPAAAPADSAAASADTSAVAVARRYLGDQVSHAVAFDIQNRTAHFIAAALPIIDWVDDPLRQGVSVAPGGHEIVLLETVDTSAVYAVSKPGLYASDLPGTPRSGPDAPTTPDTAALAQMTGVQDLDGDGETDVWAVQYGGPRHPYTWEMRAYDRDGHALYQLAARRKSGGAGLDPASWDPSANLAQNAPMRAAMEARIQALETRFAAVDTTSADTTAAAARGGR
jgi:hypothetical protein